jgi:hypothetical protein
MAEFQFQYDAMDPNASGGLTEKTWRPGVAGQAFDLFQENQNFGKYIGLNKFNDKYSKIDPLGGKIGGLSPSIDPFGGVKFAAGLFGANKDKWYRDYRKWADYWRTGMSESLGYGEGGEEAATDPLSKLQFALTNQVDMGKLKNTFDPNYDASGLVNSRNQGLAAMLRQQAAGMGVSGAYDATINNASNARQTLIDKSMAAYRPEAYQQQQTLSSNADQLLQSIQMANLDAQKSLTAAGRTV